MLSYNQELIVDSDTHRCGSYITVFYEFPEKDKEMDSYMRRSPIITITSDSNNCQKGE